MVTLHLFDVAVQAAATASRVSSGTAVAATPDTTALILRAQLAAADAYRADLLQTVYFSLGLVAAVALILIGYGWYSHFRLQERETNALKLELSSSLTTQMAATKAELVSSVNARFAALVSETEARIRSASEESLRDLTSKVAGLTMRLTHIDRSLLRLKYDDILSRARDWEIRKVPSNELFRYSEEALPIALELMDDSLIAETLTAMIRIMQQGVLPFWSYVPGIQDRLAQLPSKFDGDVATLRDLLRKVKRE